MSSSDVSICCSNSTSGEKVVFLRFVCRVCNGGESLF